MGVHNAIKYEKTGNICIKKAKTEKYLILQVFFSIRTLLLGSNWWLRVEGNISKM